MWHDVAMKNYSLMVRFNNNCQWSEHGAQIKVVNGAQIFKYRSSIAEGSVENSPQEEVLFLV